MEAVKARATQYYMADCARFICNNVANALGGNLIESRLSDMIGTLFGEDTHGSDADADDIIDRITSGLRQLGDTDECTRLSGDLNA